MKNIISIILITSYFLSFSRELSQELDSAKEAYATQDFNTAKENYESILRTEGQSTALYYNLGNTYYKLGELGKSILHYEKALKLDPENEDARFNLDLVNTKITDKIEEVSSSQSYEKIITLFHQDTYAVIGTIGFAMMLIFVLFFLKTVDSSKRRLMLNGAIVGLVIFIVGTTGAFLNNNLLNKNQYAIVLSPSVTVKSSPSIEAKNLFVIHEGLKVKVLEEQGRMAKVQIPDGNIGWVLLEEYESI